MSQETYVLDQQIQKFSITKIFRKVLIENSGDKESFTRLSADLQSTTTKHQKRSQSVKSSSAQNLHNCSNSSDKRLEDNQMVLPDEMQPPKTRFNSRNKSKEARSSTKTSTTSSPRLKSFPAEEIKKLDDPRMFSPEPIGALIVQQDPRETGTFYMNSSARNNNGHGDVISSVQLPHQQSKVKF